MKFTRRDALRSAAGSVLFFATGQAPRFKQRQISKWASAAVRATCENGGFLVPPGFVPSLLAACPAARHRIRRIVTAPLTRRDDQRDCNEATSNAVRMMLNR